jgi:bifunctional polynucleotide phosphatase/kinase
MPLSTIKVKQILTLSRIPRLSMLNQANALPVIAMTGRYLLAILSNQAGISMNSASKTVNSDKKRLADFKQKVRNVLTQLDLPIVLYAATDKDKFRKPRTGMWDKLLEAQGLTQEGDVDLDACYFVGDAGGRTAVSKAIKADFSCSDRSVCSLLAHPISY